MEHNKEQAPWLPQATTELVRSTAQERLVNAQEVLEQAGDRVDILEDIDALYQVKNYLPKQVKAMKAVLGFSHSLLERYTDFTAKRVENESTVSDELRLVQFSAFAGSHRNVEKFEEALIKEMENN